MSFENIIIGTNIILAAYLVFSNIHQLVYPLVPFFKKIKNANKPLKNNYAVIVCARNEAEIIANLFDSIKKQTYPQELITVVVAADNCTDDTAAISRKHDAVVFERFDNVRVGKSHALNFVFRRLAEEGMFESFDGFLIMDADNILSKDYLEKMNLCFSQGYKVVTSCRHSKNFGENWVAAGQAISFLHDSKCLNYARMLLNNNSLVMGTGYIVAKELLREGWNFHSLVEDAEFSVYCALNDIMAAYCDDAVFYDEQPVSVAVSLRQRLRWTKGAYQVYLGYFSALLHKIIFDHSFSCYDLLSSGLSPLIYAVSSFFANIFFIVILLLNGREGIRLLINAVAAVSGSFLFLMAMLLCFSFGTVFAEWRRIKIPAYKKILYSLTYPIFILLYYPLAIVSLFVKVKWKEIKHTVNRGIDDL